MTSPSPVTIVRDSATPSRIPGSIVLALGIAAGLALFAIGCSSNSHAPSGTQGPAAPGPPTTVAEALSRFQADWNRLDFNDYRWLIDPSYTFIFQPTEAIAPTNDPSWGLADELISVRHLFGQLPNSRGYIADSIRVSFTADPEVPNDMGNWTKVVVWDVRAVVHCHSASTGGTFDYVLHGGPEGLWFAPHGNSWLLVRWEDPPSPRGAIGFWGTIKQDWR